MITATTADGPVLFNGKHIGYVDSYTLYLYGVCVGEFSTYLELIRMIQDEKFRMDERQTMAGYRSGI
jgi:hypothetical protein